MAFSMRGLLKYLTNKDYRFQHDARHGAYKDMPDDEYLKRMFKALHGYELDLENPRTLDEKIQWLKLYNRDPLYPTIVDKVEAKKYVADLIGEEHIIPTLGVWDRGEDIDFDALPDQFVLKCSHDSHRIVICKDKSKLDREKAVKTLNEGLQRNYYYIYREWAYKSVKPRILAEQYMQDDSGFLTDYKFYCFNGKPDSVMTCFDRNTGDTKFYFFDRDWKLKRYNKRGKEAPADFTKPKPENMDQMFDIAEKLATEVKAPFLRVDLYSVYGKIYFGELTLYPTGGFDMGRLPETDKLFGDMVNIDDLRRKKQ